MLRVGVRRMLFSERNVRNLTTRRWPRASLAYSAISK
jgi:hypothetical protein